MTTPQFERKNLIIKLPSDIGKLRTGKIEDGKGIGGFHAFSRETKIAIIMVK